MGSSSSGSKDCAVILSPVRGAGTSRTESAPPDVAQDFVGGVPAGGAPDAAARMGAGAAQVQILERGAVIGEAGGRTEGEELVGRHRAMIDVPAAETEDRLEILRRADVAVDDGFR